jgi:Arc/MetJ-type ribon-helix-helix transcriptional regulator
VLIVTALRDEETIKRIDEYRSEGRFPSRMEAIRNVIRIGLATIDRQRKKP